MLQTLPLPAPVGAVALKRRRAFAAPAPKGVSYSQFIAGLTKAGVILNRKMMSEIAIRDPEGFKSIVEIAKNA